jgi:hypothetical protein
MTQLFVALVAISLVAVPIAGAQTGCPTGIPTSSAQATANARQQAADLFQFVAPQLGQAVAGGSATLGQNSTLNGFGHVSIGVHGTAVAGSIPDVANFPVCYTGARNDVALPTRKSAVPMAGADAVIGIFGGIPLAVTNVLAVDALVSAQYVPERSFSGVNVRTPDGSLQVGYGARLGLLSESILVPGLSLSYMKRDLPKVGISATMNSDTLSVTGLKVKTSSWRLAASKSLIFFGIGAGVGQDRLDSTVDSVRASVGAPAPIGRTSGVLGAQSQSLTRTNYFVNLSLSVLVAKLTAEVGQSTGGNVSTFNAFSGSQPTGARTYGSLGVRFGL